MNSFEQIAKHLNSLGLHFHTVGNEAIVLSFSGRNVSLEVSIRVSGPIVSFIATPEVGKIDEKRVLPVILLANRLNAQRMSCGALWIHPESRKINAELAVVAPEGISQEQVKLAIAAVHAADHFFPAFAAVQWGGLSADQAFALPLPSDDDKEEDSGTEGNYDIAV